MKSKVLYTILFCLTSYFTLVGQTHENDTVLVKRIVHTELPEIDTIIIPGGIRPAQQQILIGTTFLPNSDKMIGLLNQGLSPISLEITDGCDERTDPRTLKDYPKFTQIQRDSSTLSVRVSIVANCCHNFLGEAEVLGTDTLNLIYTSYGGFCGCQCCFTLQYLFDTSMEEKYQVLKYVKVNDSQTFKRIPEKR